MNKGIWTGNLTRDPETRVMTNGKIRTMFTLAVQRPYTNQQSGQREADFISFVAFERNAELAGKYLSKGRKVLVEAHVRTGSYDKDGKRIYTTEFIADRFEFLSSPSSQKQPDQETTGNQNQPQENGGFTDVSDEPNPFMDSDDMPF